MGRDGSVGIWINVWIKQMGRSCDFLEDDHLSEGDADLNEHLLGAGV
jgi:hypothetical protein